MKKKLYAILNVDNNNSKISKFYNYINIGLTVGSLIPLLFSRETETLLNIEAVAVVFFIIDYFLRWYTADIRYPKKKRVNAYLTYPITLLAIIDLLSLLPFITVLNQSLRIFRVFRLIRSLRVFRAFRLFRGSKSFNILERTIKKQKQPLMIVGILTLSYIFIAALLVFNVEPDTFPTFLQALLWATSGLTTATYGNYFPQSAIGQVISIISYLVGVAIIALPSSIITAGYIDVMENDQEIEVEENHQAEEKKDLH